MAKVKEMLTNYLFYVKRKVQETRIPRHINRIIEIASTAQHSDSPARIINQYFPETIHCKYVIMTTILLMILFSISCNEVRKLNYISFSDAVEAGEITRGWIPDYLPESSRNIRINYDITSSETWCAFEFSPDDVQNFKKALGIEVDFFPTRLKQIKRPGLWWPEFLSGNLDIQIIEKSSFSSYAIEEKCYQGFDHTRLLFFVINWKNGEGYFYRTICQSYD